MGEMFDKNSILIIVGNVFFKFVEGEWNEWRVERNWKILKEQIERKIVELDENKERR